MTLAVCLRCGAEKIGGFSPCHACGYEPLTVDARAKSLMLTDHILSARDLRDVAKRIKSGDPATFDAESVAEISKSIEESDLEEIENPIAEPLKGGWGWVVVFLGLIVAFFWFMLTR